MDRTRNWICDQIRLFRQRTVEAPVLPFADALAPELVDEIIQELQLTFRERVYTPFITLCVFLGQVFSEDHSCREAVARLLAFRIASGARPCSPDTNPYCRARQRLPEHLALQPARSDERQRIGGRRVGKRSSPTRWPRGLI